MGRKGGGWVGDVPRRRQGAQRGNSSYQVVAYQTWRIRFISNLLTSSHGLKNFLKSLKHLYSVTLLLLNGSMKTIEL